MIKPISDGAPIDIGASASILDPKILPQEFMKPYTRLTSAFEETFPQCFIIANIVGSKSPDLDITIGWYILQQTSLAQKSIHRSPIQGTIESLLIPRKFISSNLPT